MPKSYIALPLNPADGGRVKFAVLEDAIRYCSAAHRLGILAHVVVDGKIVYRNYGTTRISRWV